MGFHVAPLPLCQLLLEAPALFFRIIQLAKGVAQLEAPHVKLEALHPVWFVRLVFGQRRDRDREVVDDGGLNQVVLGDGFKDAGDGFSRGLSGLKVERNAGRPHSLDHLVYFGRHSENLRVPAWLPPPLARTRG